MASDVVASVALAAFSVAVAAGFARVFAGWEFFDNLLVLVVVGHGAGLLLRRAQLPGWIAVPFVGVLLAWTVGALHYRFTYSFLLPTGDTVDLFQSELELVRDQFRTAVAPVLYGAGWDVLASIGMAAAVLLADTFAFRAGARAEALVPGGVLFVFVAALGAERDRVALTMLVVAAGVLATVVLRSYHAPTRAVTVGRRRSRVALAVPIGIVAAVAVSLLAGVVGPRLPGARSEALYDTKGGGTGSVTTVQNPLVDIRSRLTRRSDVELFQVRANEPSYWRSMSLPAFDGTTWSLPERDLDDAGGSLATARPGTVEVIQEVRVVELGGNLVPAAPDPVAIEPASLSWTADTSTLVKTDDDLVTGETFEIVSASPRYDPDQLRRATTADPPDPIYLDLPDDFPDSVRALARTNTSGAATPYDVALQLQQWFRTEFDYSLDVQSGHGTNAMEAFLRERVGYCEQFSGTYAAMMRSLGIPARVAVGFTPGNQIPSGDYSVLGKNSHAWPEVWFDGLGWVPFEPTPGRGAPGAEEHTGVAPSQDESGVEGDPTGAAEPTVPPSTLPSRDDGGFADPAPAPVDPGTDFEVDPAALEGGGGGGTSPWWFLAAAVVIALVAPAAIRRLRRGRPLPPGRELSRLWQRSLAAARDVGVDPPPSATPLEAAALTRERFPLAARPFHSLAEVVTEATYRRGAVDELDVAGAHGPSTIRSCANWCRQIERAAGDSIGFGTRVRRYFTRLT